MALPEKYDGKSSDYRAWRTQRLKSAERSPGSAAQSITLTPELKHEQDPASLHKLCEIVREQGYALYQWSEQPENATTNVEQLHRAISLTQHDRGVVSDSASLSLLKDLSGTARGKYIPYTSQAMGWHTDGYYNDPKKTLRCFALHCIHPAATGGSLSLLDYELLLISLYDEDPDLVLLLSQNHCMKLPANKDDLGHDRPDRYASVFFNHADGSLGSRFTTRSKNISWISPDTRAAAERVNEIIASNSHWQHNIRLTAGQGVITRNILHRREAFSDDKKLPQRQMLRGRYLQTPQYAN